MELKFNNRELEKVLTQALEVRGAELQEAVDEVFDAVGRKPIPEVETALAAAFERLGGNIDGDDLTAWATAISEGRRIVIDVQRVQL